MVLGGLAVTGSAFLPQSAFLPLLIGAVLVMAVIPIVQSYVCGSGNKMTVLSLALVALTLQNADTTAPAVAVESPYTIHSGALELGGTLTMPRAAAGRCPSW